MSQLQLTLAIKPLSYNGYYRNTKYGKRIKTGLGLAYDELLDMVFEDHSIELKKFGESFDLSSHIVSFSLEIANPRFYLKDGSRISKTSGDVDNYVKILQDRIAKEMGIDDYLFRRGSQLDFPSNIDLVIITLELLPHPPYRAFGDLAFDN